MAAGLGFKTFTTGEVLTAGDVNGYLMQGILVFASTAARDASITAPQEGQFAFTKDTNGLWYYDGAAWVASGATGDIEGVTAGVGISGGGTSGTVTITNSMATAIDAKGDLVPGTGADTFARLAVGANDTVLTADSSTATGLKWAAPASGSTFVGVAVTNSGHLNIASATTTTVTFNSEFYDTDGFHSTSTNTDRLTVPSGKAGKYLVVFQTQWQANDSGASVFKYVYIQKNGDLVARVQTQGTSASGIQQVFQTSAIVDLAVGDYINSTVYTSSSNNADLYFATTTPYYSYLSMAYLGA